MFILGLLQSTWDFILVLMELFSAWCYGWGVTGENR